MAPMLGIMASQISGHLWAPAGAYDSISTATVTSGGTSSITFSSIPATYKHLQLRGISRSTRAITGTNIVIAQFNSDAVNTNYWSTHNMVGNGATAYAQSIEDVGVDGIWVGLSAGANNAANIFGAFTIDILDYKSSNKYKTTRALNAYEDNTTNGSITLVSGLWKSTAAITSITLIDNTNNNFTEFSSFALYGIK